MVRAAKTVAVVIAAVAMALPGAATAQGEVPAAGCSWWVGSNPDAVNVAYPDEGAAYWGTMLLPGTELVVRGRYPEARYFSFHGYDSLLRPTASILDSDVQPDAGDPSRYTVRIVPEPPPADPEPNTVYAGETFEGDPNPGGIVLYRVYVPDDPSDPTGGVGLPDVSLAVAGGAVEVPFGQCDLTAMLPGTGLNEAIRNADYPDAAPRMPAGGNDGNPPRWSKFFGYKSVLGLIPGNPVPPQLAPDGGGFLSNHHNEYVTAGLSRSHGDVVVMRATMPTFPDTRAGEPVDAPRQLRYWSICQNETFSQRFVACLADHQAVLDGQGRATIVVSDPGDRPANATAEDGVNWLPWGGTYPNGRLIYRQMVAAPDFAESIAAIEPGEDVRAAMGEYYPEIAYCPKEAFEQGGAEACLSP